MTKQLLLALLGMFLLTLSVAAQNAEEENAEIDPNLAIIELMVNRVVNLMSKADPSGYFMGYVSVSTGAAFLPDIKKELRITEEQEKLIEQGFTKIPATRGERTKVLYEVRSRFRSGNYEVSETELEAIDSALSDSLNAMNEIASEVYSAEQIAKMDGMILALSGGLASPLFNERHMAALDMTDEQKQKFASINEEMKEEREKMASGISVSVMKMLRKGEVNVKYLGEVLAEYREFSKELKQRRSAVLTTMQIRKMKTLSRLPKSLSVANLLPKWMPDADSWKPGDPLPEGLVPENKPTRPFPRAE